jgi:hypothetical protein
MALTRRNTMALSNTKEDHSTLSDRFSFVHLCDLGGSRGWFYGHYDGNIQD